MAKAAQERRWGVAVSACAHGLVLAALCAGGVRVLAPPQVLRPGVATGQEESVIYSPFSAAGQVATPALLVKNQPHPSAIPVSKTMLAAPVKAAPATASADAVTPPETTGQSGKDGAAGLDALGNGDIRIALASSFPRPEPDLHGLPRGFQGDVIVDVVIDPTGKISDTRLVHGVSPSVDRVVIATVEQWVFQPATRDGNPVASEQELLFHYGPV